MRCFTRRWPIINERSTRAYLWMSLVHIQSKCWKHRRVCWYTTTVNCQWEGERGAELSLSLGYWDVFMLQLRPREDSSYRTFHETVHPSIRRSYYAESFEVVGSLRDTAKAVWSSSFFPRVIPLLSGNVRVPAHLNTETPHWAVCHLPWITSTLKMCAAAAAGGRQCTALHLH